MDNNSPAPNHPVLNVFLLFVFACVVVSIIFGIYRTVKELFELENRVWEMPYAVISVLVILSPLAFLVRYIIKNKSEFLEWLKQGECLMATKPTHSTT
jgi:hypothetical protein